MLKEYIISSANRVSGTVNNFELPIGAAKKIKLTWANIPNSFNNIAQSDFRIVGLISGNVDISVPAGRYTATQILNLLQLQINMAGFSVELSGNQEIIINSLIELFYITNVTGNIGFQNSSTPVSQIKSKSLISILQVDAFIMVCSSQVRGIDNGCVVANNHQENIIHAVPLSNGTVMYAPLESVWVTVFQNLSNFYLKFQNNFPVNLNGADWSIKLMVQF